MLNQKVNTNFKKVMADCDDMPPLEDEVPVSSSNIHPVQNRMSSEINSDDYDEEEEQDYNDFDEWEEMTDEPDEKSKCLFCTTEVLSVAGCFKHIEEDHGVCIPGLVVKHHMDQISFIQFVNFIRTEGMKANELVGISPSSWNKDKYMKPALDCDPLLMHDIEHLQGNDMNYIENMDSNLQCQELREIVSKQRDTLQRLLDASQEPSKHSGEIRTVSDIRVEEDEGYFNSYAHFAIHHEMLSDKVRTESYRDALMKNSEALAGKNVLDLGCGTSILCMFAAKAGAASVTGVDMSEVVYHAMDIVKENELDKIITIRKGKMEDLEFEHNFDFIVSEWMGYFLLFEGMLDSVLYARDKHLNAGGMLLPNRCTMHMVGLEDLDSHTKLISFWNNIYGFKMTCMRNEVIKEASTEVVKGEHVITSAAQIADFDLMKITPQDTEFKTSFSLQVSRDGHVTGFVGYFDTYFDLPHPVSFSTGPHAPPTHWKQTVFYLAEPRVVKKGEMLDVSISVRRRRKEIRSLDVVIEYDNKKRYFLVE
ncbi:protein arginine N-methyltransferase 1-like isoform X2 [Oratosquilla oratoria]|uniref:protein arginine N-methyltransferase 1-like isoform X2 n=1 Tax=Oratosquilla oratoria TaxID=337810 RepID=UPI003F776063